MSVINENIIIDNSVINKLLVHAAKIIARVTSAAVKGAETTSPIVFIIFPIIMDEEVCAKLACKMDMEIKPGHKNVTKGTPKISPLYSPIGRFKTDQKSKVVTIGLNMV